MSLATGSVKIIQGFVTSSQDSSIPGSFAKELGDFYNTLPVSGSTSGYPSFVSDVGYVVQQKNYPGGGFQDHYTAIITLSGSLP